MPTVAECANCGGPLPSGPQTIRCAYCGRENSLPVAAATPYLHRAPGTIPEAKSPRVIVFAAVGLCCVIGAISMAATIGLRMTHRSAPAHPPTVAAPPRAPSQELEAPVCPLGDVDGDGIGDYAALVCSPSGSCRASRVDGATGAITPGTGDAPPYDRASTQAFCPARGWLGVAEEDAYSVTLLAGASLEPRVPTHAAAASSRSASMARAETSATRRRSATKRCRSSSTMVVTS